MKVNETQGTVRTQPDVELDQFQRGQVRLLADVLDMPESDVINQMIRATWKSLEVNVNV